MANDLPPWGVDNEIPDDWFRPRWWFWAGVLGMLVGWLVGLAVKPDVHDIHQAALDLVPTSAVVVEETVVDIGLVAFNRAPPFVYLHLTSESSPDRLTKEVRTRAQESGWRPINVDESSGNTIQNFETLFLRAHTIVFSSPDRDHNLIVGVNLRDGIGGLVTASISLTVGVVAALVVGFLTRSGSGEERSHVPMRWWHLLGIAMMGLFFWLAVGFVL